jgi:rhodanese-related sulfurtransferase
MKKKPIVKFLFFLCGFLILQSCSKTTYTGVKFEKFSQFSTTCKTYLVVDTRSEEDYEKGHIQHTINIPFSKNFLTHLQKHLSSNNLPNSLILFMYASTAYITENQVSEIKQNLKHQKILKINRVYYLADDYKF